MKDNNQKLNNDAAESVAGGAKKDSGFFQKRKLKSYMKKLGLTGEELEEKFKSNINDLSPVELRACARRKGILDDELNKILS